MIQRGLHCLYVLFCWIILCPILFSAAITARAWKLLRLFKRIKPKPRLLWAGAPMPSLAEASRALKSAGYDSLCVVNQFNSNNIAGQFDVMLMGYSRRTKGLNTPAYVLNAVRHFIKAMFTRDIAHHFFNGGILGHTPLLTCEAIIWKLAGGKVVLFAYGQDGFVYEDLPEEDWADALKETYPRTSAIDDKFKRRIAHMSNMADCVVGCILHTVTLPRVDVWPVLWYPAPVLQVPPKSKAGAGMRIAHPTNHRKIKGTQALIDAVEACNTDGLKIDLDLIEGVPISESRGRLAQSDVVVDQLLMGYAMTALEGLRLGKPVISGFDNSAIYQPFYEKSYLSDCPIICSNPDKIEETLRRLYAERDDLRLLVQAGTDYVNKYHSAEACKALFEAIYDKIWYLKSTNFSELFMPKPISDGTSEIDRA